MESGKINLLKYNIIRSLDAESINEAFDEIGCCKGSALPRPVVKLLDGRAMEHILSTANLV